MIDYINDLVNGDAQSLRSKYTPAVIKELSIPDKFTQQRVYEALFTELKRQEVSEKGEIYFKYEFKAEYKIQRNDGTFRHDLASDSVKGQYLNIEYHPNNDSIQITQVVEYAVK